MNIHKNKLAPMPESGDRIRVALVYQAGIANVFRVNCFNLGPFGRDAMRIYQGDFRGAEMLALGMAMAGSIVQTLACNQAGDIQEAQWSDDLEAQPFSDKFNPVFYTVGI